MKALKHSLLPLLLITLPTFTVLIYNDYQQRQLESTPEVYGVEYTSIKSALLTKILPDQHEILATNLYFEGRGEGETGMIAVANVVNNRIKDAEFPKDYYSVITQPKQFSWYSPKKSLTIDDEESWHKAQKIASLAMDNKIPDYSNGARFYANLKKVDSKKHKWTKEYVVLNKVGNHTFMDKATYVKKNNLPISKQAKQI
jgi:spore germination cell wall hydrolase CwlJ-like protein